MEIVREGYTIRGSGCGQPRMSLGHPTLVGYPPAVRLVPASAIACGFLLAACRPRDEPKPGGVASPPSAASSLAPVLTVAPRSPPFSGTALRCANDGACAKGERCFFVQPGCDLASRDGECHEAGWSHECVVNRPMCGCDGRTLWGPCAGITHERWAKLEGCGCRGDGDCVSGQVCFFPRPGCDQPGVCEDASRVQCFGGLVTFMDCKGSVTPATCAKKMREPWSKAVR